MLSYFCESVLKTVRFVRTCPLLYCVLFRSVRQILLFSLCLCLCVSVSLSLSLCLCLSLCLSVCLSVSVSLCLSVSVSLSLSLCFRLSLPLSLSLSLFLCLCLSLSLPLSVCLSFFLCLSVCLFVCPPLLECRLLLVWDRNCKLKQNPEIRNRSYNNSSSSCFLQVVCRACVEGTIEVNANPACYQHSM